jgi:hypothetical protein
MASRAQRRSRSAPTDGPRTTLRVPERLIRTVDELAGELGVSRNDALIRLAARGAEQYERERWIAERRDRRWEAVLASLHDLPAGEFPPPDEATAAVLEARNPDR